MSRPQTLEDFWTSKRPSLATEQPLEAKNYRRDNRGDGVEMHKYYPNVNPLATKRDGDMVNQKLGNDKAWATNPKGGQQQWNPKNRDMFSTQVIERENVEFPNPNTDKHKLEFYNKNDGMQSPRYLVMYVRCDFEITCPKQASALECSVALFLSKYRGFIGL